VYWYQSEAEWHAMCDDMPQGSIAIINPASGPGSKADVEAYNGDIEYCQEKGQKVIGYVPTNYGLEEETAPKSETFYTKSYIENAVSLYYEATSDKINGIFYDEFGEDTKYKTLTETKEFYKSLAPVPDGGFTLANAGAEAAEGSWQLELMLSTCSRDRGFRPASNRSRGCTKRGHPGPPPSSMGQKKQKWRKTARRRRKTRSATFTSRMRQVAAGTTPTKNYLPIGRPRRRTVDCSQDLLIRERPLGALFLVAADASREWSGHAERHDAPATRVAFTI
jgi:hypothetical protein